MIIERLFIKLKNVINALAVILAFVGSVTVAGAIPPVETAKELRTAKIDQLVGEAISRGLIAGAVVVIGNSKLILYEHSYGRMSSEHDALLMEISTIFDLASLTKVVATTPAILKLVEEKRISLVDPVVRWFPEFAGNGKDDLLVMNLLTHTSDLDDFPIAEDDSLQSAILGAASQKKKGEIGNRFKYADINFILLGELVKRAGGMPLDQFATEKFFLPLGMKDTSFNPDKGKTIRLSATIGTGNSLFIGVPQDYEARRLGGVAGHAGLFSTGRDLSRFCRMLLGRGFFAGQRILSERAVNQMTAPYFSRNGRVVRGLGWDISSPYSSPKGNGFSDVSFGHTGYSGTSIWIDPENDMFVALLTARTDYLKTKEFNQFRGDLSSRAAELFGLPCGNGKKENSVPE